MWTLGVGPGFRGFRVLGVLGFQVVLGFRVLGFRVLVFFGFAFFWV